MLPAKERFLPGDPFRGHIHFQRKPHFGNNKQREITADANIRDKNGWKRCRPLRKNPNPIPNTLICEKAVL